MYFKVRTCMFGLIAFAHAFSAQAELRSNLQGDKGVLSAVPQGNGKYRIYFCTGETSCTWVGGRDVTPEELRQGRNFERFKGGLKTAVDVSIAAAPTVVAGIACGITMGAASLEIGGVLGPIYGYKCASGAADYTSNVIDRHYNYSLAKAQNTDNLVKGGGIVTVQSSIADLAHGLDQRIRENSAQ